MKSIFAVMLMLALLISLVTTGGPDSVAAQIPAEVRAIANTWAFLASMGRRCETRLEWMGYLGTLEDVCRDFSGQYDHMTKEFSAKQDLFTEAARAAAALPSLVVRMEFEAFVQEFEDSTAKVFKAMQHIVFLRKAEVERRKKPENGKKK